MTAQRILAQLAARASRRHGVIVRADLTAAGISRNQTRWAVSCGTLIASGRHTFRFAAAPETWRQRAMIAVVEAGPGAALSHRSAARLLRFDRFAEPDVLEVVVPHGRSPRPRRAVIIHRTETLRAVDRSKVESIPCTSGTRTLIDLSGSAIASGMLEAAVDSALRDRRTDPDSLRAQIERLRTQRRPGLNRLLALLDGSPEGGLHSVLEREFYNLVRRVGLPLPKTQVVFTEGTKHVARVDFWWKELTLVIEVSGRLGHSNTEADRRRAATRHRRLTAQGIRWLEFTSTELFETPFLVEQELPRYFPTLGFRGLA